MTLPLLATRAFTAAFLVLMMLSMGLVLGGEAPIDKASKRHKRRFILVGLAFNLVLLPLVAVTLTRTFEVSDEIAVALLLLAAAPGGRFAPQLGRIAHADLGISVELTLFLAKLVAFTSPVTARLMLRTHHLEIHELPLIVQLALLQMLPYIAGRLLRKKRPALAARIARPIELATWSCVVVLAAILVARMHGQVAMLAAAPGWWPVLIFALAAPALGWLVGGREPGTRRAIAISANARDVALASMLASLAFDERVQTATLGVWALLLLINLAFARLIAGHPRRRGVAHPLAATGGSP
jgi:BASS family bile acid:Na+ symporter